MDNERVTRYWMIFAGISLVAAGLIGFVPGNPIASESQDALFRVNAIHNLVHIVTGALAIYIGWMLRGTTLANWTIGFGVLYVAVAVLVYFDPTLFGLFASAPANFPDHLLHAALGIVSVGLGWMARQTARA